MRDLCQYLKARKQFLVRSILRRNALIVNLRLNEPKPNVISFKPRLVFERKPEKYTESAWGRMLRDPNIQNPLTNAGKIFRRRFRVPYPIFEDILGSLFDICGFDNCFDH